MGSLLKGVAAFVFVVCFIVAVSRFIDDQQLNGLAWIVSGGIGAILFYAIALILEYVEDMHWRIREIERETFKNAPAPPKLGNSKANLEKLRNFKL